MSLFSFFADRPYRRDAALVRTYTGMDLSREIFDAYKGRFTLGAVLGSGANIHRQYYAYGIPLQSSQIDVTNSILHFLGKAGIVFDIDKEGGPAEPLFDTLLAGAQYCLTQDEFPRIHAPYNASPRLDQAIRNVRQRMGMDDICHVM